MSRRKGRKKRRPSELLGFVAIAAFVVGLVWLMFFTPPLNPVQTTTSSQPTLALAPNFVLTDVDGKVFRLSDYRGRIVVLEFMRTTCGACITQESKMRELHSTFGDVVMVVISVDPRGDTEEILRDHRDQNLFGWIAMRDTAGVTTTYDVQATPTIVIIDKNGNVAYQHVGLTEFSILRSEISSLS